MLPIVLCVDVEPDQRLPRAEPVPFWGFEAMLERVSKLRDELGDAVGAPPQLTWMLRMDPHIEMVYGSAAWVPERYGDDLRAQMLWGDEVGIHPHMWRPEPDGWWSDNADAAWVEHCVGTSLDAFAEAFGRPCAASRCGDRFLSPAIVRQLEAAGVVVDLTVEPGLPAAASLAVDEPTRGTLPDTRAAPTWAYRMSTDDLFAPDPDRTSALVQVPLTPGAIVCCAPTGGADPRPSGTYRTLALWTEPTRFALRLARRLRAPALTHLAFAIRADAALLPGPWAAIEANLRHLAAAAGPSARIVGAQAAIAGLAEHLDTPPRTAPEPPATRAWRHGADDVGPREGLDPSLAPAEEPSDLAWLDDVVTVSCRVCGRSGTGRRIVRTVPTTGVGLEGHRCDSCGSLNLLGPHVGRSATPAHLEDPRADRYVEVHGAVEVLAATLARAGSRPPGTRVVAVGCGYGFELAIAADLWGWTSIGVDPGALAELGARALGHRLVPEPYRADIDVGSPVDVVIASEVIEHVDHPLALLQAARSHLSDDGVLVLTTPDAEVVGPTQGRGEVLAALGSGGHVHLVSERALRALLHAAGFPEHRVERSGATLVALAAPNASGLVPSRVPAPDDLSRLARWARDRAARAPAGSSLRVGLLARAARFHLHTGELAAADSTWEELRSVVAERHGVDVGAPSMTMDLVASGDVPPVVLGDAHHTRGVLCLHRTQDADAVAHLLAAASVARHWASQDLDPAHRRLEATSLGEAAIALARVDPGRVHEVLDQLDDLTPDVGAVVDVVAMRQRTLTELVARGHYLEAARLAAFPAPSDASLARPGDARRAALDALFSTAMLRLHTGAPADAARGFRECADLAERFPDDPHAERLASDAEAHVLIAQRWADAG